MLTATRTLPPRSKKPYRTKNQREVMGIILKAAGEGQLLSLAEIHAAISYGAALGSVRGTLNFLIEGEMLVSQRDGRSLRYVPTQKGYDWFRPAKA